VAEICSNRGRGKKDSRFKIPNSMKAEKSGLQIQDSKFHEGSGFEIPGPESGFKIKDSQFKI
jgi:hypothetical protein